MAQSFPRKGLPSNDVAPNALAEHITAADPHTQYLKKTDTSLGTKYVTIFNRSEEFRTMPSGDSGLFNPKLVIYTGENATDSITGVTYYKHHPYVYSGNNVTINNVQYPIWTDHIGDWNVAIDGIVKSYLYQHATDEGGLLTNVHPTLARKNHTHSSEEILLFDQKVRTAINGLYPYICQNAEDITEIANLCEEQRLDGVLIIYVGKEQFYIDNVFFKQSHIYLFSLRSVMWTDITVHDYYSTNQIDSFFDAHNRNVSPFSHNNLAPKVHTHGSEDINGIDSKVENIANDVCSVLVTNGVNSHNVNAEAHPDIRALIRSAIAEALTGHELFEMFYLLTTKAPQGAVPLDGRTLTETEYPQFYRECVLRWNNGVNPTIACTSEEGYAESMATYGQCGRFVIDTINKAVKIPTITHFIQCATNINDLGQVYNAGLPNITGSMTLAGAVFIDGADGAFKINDTRTANTSGAPMPVNQSDDFVFSAADSNDTYGRSDTVQPQSIKGCLYLQVKTSRII